MHSSGSGIPVLRSDAFAKHRKHNAFFRSKTSNGQKRMRPSIILLKGASSSSKQWLSRQARDPAVKARNQSLARYRSRSVFKLDELNGKFKLFGPAMTNIVIDLGAAPGGWSQLVAERFGFLKEDGQSHGDSKEDDSIDKIISEESSSWSASSQSLDQGHAKDKTIIAVDILPMAPIPGVRTVRQDFLDPRADNIIASLLPSSDAKADLILSDIAVNISGNKIRDSVACEEVCHAVVQFAKKYLKKGSGKQAVDGGHLVLKFFADEGIVEFRKRVLVPLFHSVYIVKPRTSRSESSENYFVCRRYKGEVRRKAPRDAQDTKSTPEGN